MKKWMALCLALILVLTAAGCRADGGAQPTEKKDQETNAAEQSRFRYTVGVCMPNDGEYWANGVAELERLLEEMDCGVEVAYAQDQVAEQQEQVEEFIEEQVDCLVIAAVDSVALLELEQDAREAGIPIVAYDRLLMDTDAADVLVTFDYAGIGATMAQYIVEARQLQSAQEENRSYTIEFFMGSPDDNSAFLLHQGIMTVLQHYLDSGVLVARTGRTSFEDTCILRWEKQTAADKCGSYLEEYYTEQKLDIVCAASDALAEGCAQALFLAGYEGETWPTVTGQGGDASAVKAILDGRQTMTVYKDRDTLVQKCAGIIMALIKGTEPEINDTVIGSNHVTTVPAYVCSSVMVDADNYESVLIDGGIYTEKQLGIQK